MLRIWAQIRYRPRVRRLPLEAIQVVSDIPQGEAALAGSNKNGIVLAHDAHGRGESSAWSRAKVVNNFHGPQV